MTDKHNDSYIIRLDKGEEIISTIKGYCKKNEIFGAWFSGLGAVSSAVLSFYDLKNKKFVTEKFSNDLELISLSGNIGISDKEIIVHAHALLSNEKMATFGGHLKSATVSATCEIKLDILDIDLKRKYDKESGLKIINID